MKNNLLFMAMISLLFIMACSKKNSTPDTNLTPQPQSNLSQYALMGLDSPFISIDSANIMISSYLGSLSSTSTDAKSFIVDADALRYYLNNTDIKHVKLMFAHKMSYVRSGHKNQPAGMNPDGLTIVIAGYGEDNDYIYSPQGAVMDFSQPCPYFCPEGGTAAYDLFPVAQ
jgi:hypothetical protein